MLLLLANIVANNDSWVSQIPKKLPEGEAFLANKWW